MTISLYCTFYGYVMEFLLVLDHGVYHVSCGGVTEFLLTLFPSLMTVFQLDRF